MRHARILTVALGLILCAPAFAAAQWRVEGSEVAAALDHRRWSDGRDAWNEMQIAARRNTKHGAGIVRVSHVERGAAGDDRIEAEVYPLFKGGYAALAAGISRNGSVYPHSAWSAEVFVSPLEQLETSVGFRRINFDTGINVISGSAGLYHREFLFGTRVYHATSGGTLFSVTARRYLGAEAQHHYGAQVAAGSVPAELRAPSDIQMQSTRSIAADAQFVVRSRIVLRARAELARERIEGRDASAVFGGTVGFGVRF